MEKATHMFRQVVALRVEVVPGQKQKITYKSLFAENHCTILQKGSAASDNGYKHSYIARMEVLQKLFKIKKNKCNLCADAFQKERWWEQFYCSAVYPFLNPLLRCLHCACVLMSACKLVCERVHAQVCVLVCVCVCVCRCDGICFSVQTECHLG